MNRFIKQTQPDRYIIFVVSDLILIKHSLPEIAPEVPANQWHLSKLGREKCELLAQELFSYSVDSFVSSDETKAVETAQILASICKKELAILPGLHEHDRTNVPFGTKAQFESLVSEFFKRPTEHVMGKETATQAYERFNQAVDAVI